MKPQTQTQKDADRHRHTHSVTHHTDSHHNRRKTATGQIELAQIGKSASFSTDVTVFALFVPGDMCVVLSSPPSRGLRCHLPPRPFFWVVMVFGLLLRLELLFSSRSFGWRCPFPSWCGDEVAERWEAAENTQHNDDLFQEILAKRRRET